MTSSTNRCCSAPPTSACCAPRSWIPQGLWAFGIGSSSLLIVLLLVENALLLVAGRARREAEALLHTRTYEEEAAEALEAVGAQDRDRGAMIAILFLLVLVGLTVVLSLIGAGGRGNVLIWQSLLLVAPVLAFLRRRHLCRRRRSACSA